jgi:hypothetical protein
MSARANRPEMGIATEQSTENKRLYLQFLKSFDDMYSLVIEEVANGFFSHSAQINASHPINEAADGIGYATDIINPIIAAFDGCTRQNHIVLSGEYLGTEWVTSTGYFHGQFRSSLFGIPPSGKLAFLRFGEFHRLENGKITNRPLAGTRRRGYDQAEDIALEQELLADPKEIAEHLMLIDLGRNDVGRVAESGTVEVTEQFVIERYSHVMHISSNVEGILKEGKTAMDLLRATLPVGTLSGAPKVRAMEIIDELEPVKRGIYGGAVGYLAWNGNMDTAIAIRTAVVKDGKLYIEAGGGIVHDSVPRLEWKESLNKGRAIFRAAAMAENQFRELDD